MADYKYPNDGTASGEESLITDKTISFPDGRMDEGFSRAFEVKIIGVTVLDTNVSFRIYSGLDADILDSDNIVESVESIDLTGLTGNLVFQRSIINTLDTAFKIVISGTDSSSAATFLIRARSE